jgi:hypothetical protein
MPERADCLRTSTGYWLETVFYVFEYIRNGEPPWAALGNFIDDWQGSTTSNEQRQAMVADPISDAGADPELQRWAAFCAAMAEELCTKAGIAVRSSGVLFVRTLVSLYGKTSGVACLAGGDKPTTVQKKKHYGR